LQKGSLRIKAKSEKPSAEGGQNSKVKRQKKTKKDEKIEKERIFSKNFENGAVSDSKKVIL